MATPDLPPAPAGADDETMTVSKARLRSFLQDLDTVRGERDTLAGEVADVRAELEALQAHLQGALAENVRLRERVAARGAGPDPRTGPQPSDPA
jgi:hypothetical protein